MKYSFCLQKVDYPVELDVYDLCSDDLRKKLEAPRKVCIFPFASMSEGWKFVGLFIDGYFIVYVQPLDFKRRGR